jgi:hypothetical protein
MDHVAEVDWLLRFVTSLTLNGAEVVEVVPDVKVPQGRLSVIEHTGPDTDFGVL